MGESDAGKNEDEETVEETRNLRKPKQVIRQRWDEDEMDEIQLYFKSYLDSKICPRKMAVEAAKRQSKSRGGKIWKRSFDKIIKTISNINHKK